MFKYLICALLIFITAEIMVVHLRMNRCASYAAGVVKVFENQKNHEEFNDAYESIVKMLADTKSLHWDDIFYLLSIKTVFEKSELFAKKTTQ